MSKPCRNPIIYDLLMERTADANRMCCSDCSTLARISLDLATWMYESMQREASSCTLHEHIGCLPRTNLTLSGRRPSEIAMMPFVRWNLALTLQRDHWRFLDNDTSVPFDFRSSSDGTRIASLRLTANRRHENFFRQEDEAKPIWPSLWHSTASLLLTHLLETFQKNKN